jgi:hypothetical protein
VRAHLNAIKKAAGGLDCEASRSETAIAFCGTCVDLDRAKTVSAAPSAKATFRMKSRRRRAAVSTEDFVGIVI